MRAPDRVAYEDVIAERDRFREELERIAEQAPQVAIDAFHPTPEQVVDDIRRSLGAGDCGYGDERWCTLPHDHAGPHVSANPHLDPPVVVVPVRVHGEEEAK